MSAALIELRSVSRGYPGVQALSGVDFDVRAGEVHALAGSNGAGKSTLVRILGGVERPDAGAVRVGGVAVRFASPLDAMRAGVAVLHQETHLVPQLTVAENFFLGRELRRGWRLDWAQMRRRTRAALEQLGLELDVERAAGELPAALAQIVGIARAVDLQARVLVLDEPTSSLDRGEVERLFALLGGLRARGLGLVFIAHSLDQIYAVADRITVLRDGRDVGTFAANALPRERLVALMLGREGLAVADGKRAPAAAQPAPFVEARGLGCAGAIEPFDVAFARGEVVGLAGLLGSGRSELARVLYGAARATSGTLRVDGVEQRLRSPRAALAHGLALAPEDRKQDGVFPSLSVAANIALIVQRQRSRWGFVRPSAHAELARGFITSLGIVARGPEQPMGTLSGGNQQKVLLARLLACEPRLLMLDEPTRGIDVGAKVDVERLVEELAERGTAVLFISSALEEVLRRASRVLVLRDRRVVAELAGDELREQRVLELLSSAGETRG